MTDSDTELMGDFPPVSYKRWRERVQRDLGHNGFDQRLGSRSLDGIDVAPIYTRTDWPGNTDEAGLPGVAPYRRGPLPDGRSGSLWDMRQRYAHPDPGVCRRQIAAELGRGASSLRLVFDSRLAYGGTPAGDGIVCNNASELGDILADVALESVPLALEPGAADLGLAAYLAVVASRRGVPASRLRGTLGADPLGTLASTGQLPISITGAQRNLAALAAWANLEAPNLRAVSVSTAPYHDAGAGGAIELGAALSAGVSYLRWMTEAGLSASEAARQIQFSVSIGSEFFAEVAKLRALRQCWSRVVAASGGDEEAQRAPIQTTTSARTKSVRDPWVNMLRTTTEAFSAAVGGADAISTDPFDIAIGPPDDFARRIASNAQLVLNEESHVARVADPAGGAYYVESLTDRLAQMAWASFQVLEAEGGLGASLAAGGLAERVQTVADLRAAEIASRRRSITGVNEFANLDEKPPSRVPTAAAGAAPSILAGSAAPLVGHGAGLVRSAITMVMQGVCVADLASGARAAQGAQAGGSASVQRLAARRDAAPYEALRDRSDAFLGEHGRRPTAFLVNLGPIPKHKARSSYAVGFLHAGGIACLDNDGFPDPDAAATAFAEGNHRMAVLCGSDGQYETWVEALAPRLVAAGAEALLLAGRPGAEEARYCAAGVTGFIYVGCDALGTLAALLDQMGVN